MPGGDILDPGHRHRRQRVAVALLALLAIPAAAGAWSASGAGAAATRANALAAGGQPLAVGVLTTVSLSWSAGPIPGTAYVVKRYNGMSGALSSIGGTCTGVVTGTSCSDTSVPIGTWRYAVTPVHNNWTGTEGARSLLVSITL